MLDIATNFFKNLYTADEIDDNMVNFFLEHVELIVNNQFYMMIYVKSSL